MRKKEKWINCDVCKSTKIEPERAVYVPPPPLETYVGKSPFSQHNYGRTGIRNTGNRLRNYNNLLNYLFYITLLSIGILIGFCIGLTIMTP